MTLGLLAGLWSLSYMRELPARPSESAEITQAEVVAVTPRRSPGRGVTWRGRVMVKLEEGSRHRLTLRRPLPRVGDTLPVVVIADGNDGELTVQPVR